MRLSENCFEDG